MKITKSKNQIDKNNLKDFFNTIKDKYICGVDEAGRGPLAGPVVAAAVILPKNVVIEELKDSKKMTASQRDRVYERITRMSLMTAVGIIENKVIDKINILQASLLAMQKAVQGLKEKADVVIVDGIYEIPNLQCKQHTVIAGDTVCTAISAASVIAKVTRDRIMDEYQSIFPSFSFSNHKGYPTSKHLKELKKYGPTAIHRKTFKPVAEILNQYVIFEKQR